MNKVCLQSVFPWYVASSVCFTLISQAAKLADNWRQQKLFYSQTFMKSESNGMRTQNCHWKSRINGESKPACYKRAEPMKIIMMFDDLQLIFSWNVYSLEPISVDTKSTLTESFLFTFNRAPSLCTLLWSWWTFVRVTEIPMWSIAIIVTNGNGDSYHCVTPVQVHLY